MTKQCEQGIVTASKQQRMLEHSEACEVNMGYSVSGAALVHAAHALS